MPASTASSRPRSPRAKRDPFAERRRHLLDIYARLLKHFGPRNWWPAERPWEMIVGAILVQNTAWRNVEKALKALKGARALSLPKIAALPRERLERLIHASGFFRQKAERLQRFSRHLLAHPMFYRQLLGKSDTVPLPTLRADLLAQNGIGPETADSILLYAGGYPMFVVDAYTRRIGQRVGLFRYNDYGRVQAYFQDVLPEKAALYNEFHALLVWLAKSLCTKRDPKCPDCPLLARCRYGRRRVSARRVGK
jgi:endonuclease-3 related protein